MESVGLPGSPRWRHLLSEFQGRLTPNDQAQDCSLTVSGRSKGRNVKSAVLDTSPLLPTHCLGWHRCGVGFFDGEAGQPVLRARTKRRALLIHLVHVTIRWLLRPLPLLLVNCYCSWRIAIAVGKLLEWLGQLMHRPK